MRAIARACAWLCVAGALADGAVLAHMLVSGAAFSQPLVHYLSSGPDILAGVALLLDAALPGPLWRTVQDLAAGGFFAARLLTLCALAFGFFALASRSRSADS